jgi:RNA-binding protein Nova
MEESSEVSAKAHSEITRHDQPTDAELPSERLDSSEIGTKDSLPRSPTPTMKTESVDTDSASSSGTASHEPSAASQDHGSSTQEVKSMSTETQVALKLLVSNGASGLIIGRSGSTISDLQARSRSRIKLSQDGHFYPGTSDRVCLIQGSLSNASLGVEMVLSKLYDLQSIQQLTSTLTTTNLNESLPVAGALPSFIVRLLVPSTFCGKIIGRNGSNIKALKDQSDVSYIQLSPKDHEMISVRGNTTSTSERIMTIIGPNLTSCVRCTHMILEDMAQNSDISRYINITTIYSQMSASLTTSSYAAASTSGFYLEQESFHHGILPGGDPSTFTPAHSFDQGMFPSPPRIHDASPLSSSFPQYHPSPSQSAPFCPPFFANNSPIRVARSTGGENLMSVDQHDRNFQPRFEPIAVKLGVPETKIGSLLGRGGKNLTELQALSHTKIRISQQEEFIPGTKNRIVTITGTTAEVEHAKHLVRQCLSASGNRTSLLSDIKHLL